MSRPPLYLLLLSMLCACSQMPIAVELQPRLPVPASLLTCADSPGMPAVMATESDLLTYTDAIAAAGDECRGHLGRVRELLVH